MGYVIGELKVSALCYRQRRHGREDVSRIGWELIKIDRVKLLVNGIKGWNKKGERFSGEIFNQDVYRLS